MLGEFVRQNLFNNTLSEHYQSSNTSGVTQRRICNEGGGRRRPFAERGSCCAPCRITFEPQIDVATTFFRRLSRALIGLGIDLRYVAPIYTDRFMVSRFEGEAEASFISLLEDIADATRQVVDHV